jgi:hypothetical protein
MSYGQNLPWGLRAVKYLNGSPFTGNVDPYPIKSGYGNNIFQGDPVILIGGYIASLFDATLQPTNFKTTPILGVFNGCSFTVPGAANVDPASPGEKYWPANQATLNGQNATAFIITDPNVVYNIQATTTVTAIQPGLTANINVLTSGDPNYFVSGNTNTGISTAYLDVVNAVNTGATSNLVIRGFVPVPGNVAGVTYNNVEVLIQNHRFATRPIFPS